MFAFLALHLWQSTLILIAAWVLARACRRNAAAVRYWIWLAASAKFLVPFAWLQQFGDYLGRSLPEPLPVDAALLETGNALFVPSLAGLVRIPDGLLVQALIVVATIWALGTATLLLRWLAQWRAIDSTLLSAPQISMNLPVPVRVTPADLTPGVFGVLRPVVILPRTVMRELSPEQLQAVLAHEMCHVHRRDNLTAVLHKCVEVIFWFYPPVWWIGANLLREREAACDQSVIEQGFEQALYAESILQVCRLGATADFSGARFSGIAASTGGSLTQRMSSIMSKERVLPTSHGRCALLLVTAMVACYGPIAAGIVAGSLREAAAGPITFDAITLEPSTPAWWHSAEFDREAGRLALKNVSLRHLIGLAYPGSKVNSEPELIDGVHYDIEARWHEHGRASARSVYRELLNRILRAHSNLRIYAQDRCDGQCD